MVDLTPYAGRWVALIDEQVVGVGTTAVSAQQAARHNRPRERVVVRFVEPDAGQPLPLSPLLEQIRPFLATQTLPVYLVGGAIRDALLGRTSKDLDFVVPHSAIKLTFQIADLLGLPAYALDRERDTGRVVLPDAATTLDFARFRGSDLESDLRERDFTVNALALPATAKTEQSIIDPTGGLGDIIARELRPAHLEALNDDPLRALRAIRLAFSLGFNLLPETETAVQQAAPRLTQVSNERIRDELTKIIQGNQPQRALAVMADLGLLAVTLPELAALAPVEQSPPHHTNVWEHTLLTLRWLLELETAVLAPDGIQNDAVQNSLMVMAREQLLPFRADLGNHFTRPVDGGINGYLLLRLGTVFHDVGKAQTQSVDENGRIRFLGHDSVGAELAAARLRALSFSNAAVEYVRSIISGHMRPLLLLIDQGEQPSRRAVYRYFRATQSAGVDIALLSLADHLATFALPQVDEQWEQLLNLVNTLFTYYFEQYDEIVKPQALVNGREIMHELNLHPGPEVGRILRLIEEAQASGEIHSREEAILYARQLIN